MIYADLEQFAATGILGSIDSMFTRTLIERLLGPPDPGGYPDFASYGHLCFDLAGGTGPPCRIQIAFPHPSHSIPANPDWTDWMPPTCFNDWPDKRFNWNLGRLIPGLSLDDAIAAFDRFRESEMFSPTNELRILHNSNSNVDLLFKHDITSGEFTLTNMVAHPPPTAKELNLADI